MFHYRNKKIKNLKLFVVNIYGQQASSSEINDEIFNLTYKMLSESVKCSEIMNLVLRPLSVGKILQNGLINK